VTSPWSVVLWRSPWRRRDWRRFPHTDKEVELLGDAADSVKTDIVSRASDLAEQGKDIASEAYDKAVAVASDVHDATKDRIVEEVDQFKDRNA
jgi:hypothetical protein